jgi:hypothetical protein
MDNAQGICKKKSFLVDGTKIQESWVGTKVEELVAKTKIQDSQAKTINYEEWIKIKIHDISIGIKIHEVWRNENLWLTKISCPRIEILYWEWKTSFLNLGPLNKFFELAKIVEICKLTTSIDSTENP